MLHIFNKAAMEAHKAYPTSSASLLTLIAEAASKYMVCPEAVAVQYQKLYPGKMYPTRTRFGDMYFTKNLRKKLGLPTK